MSKYVSALNRVLSVSPKGSCIHVVLSVAMLIGGKTLKRWGLELAPAGREPKSQVEPSCEPSSTGAGREEPHSSVPQATG